MINIFHDHRLLFTGDDICPDSLPTVTADMNNYLKKKHNLTYRDIRSFLKCGTETINIVSNGDQNNVRIEIVVKLAELLNVSLDELVKIDLEDLEKNT